MKILKILFAKFFHTIILATLVVSAYYLYNWAFSSPTLANGESRTEIKAEEVERILEMNAAKERVQVRFDTAYTSIQYHVNIVGMKFSAYDVRNELSQITFFELKAGSSDFKIVDNELFIPEPKITSVEELSGEREILKQEGEWSAVAMKAISIKSKSLAQSAALDKGILAICKINIESAFAPMKVKVVWTK